MAIILYDNFTDNSFDTSKWIDQQQYIYITGYNTPTTSSMYINNLELSDYSSFSRETATREIASSRTITNNRNLI